MLEAEVIETETPLVLVHGWKGSHLDHEKTKKRAYLSYLSPFMIHNPELALPMTWKEEGGVLRQDKDDLIATEPLSSFLGIDVYGSIIELGRSLNRPFYYFTYDWRRDDGESTELLIQYLYKVREHHQNHKIQIIAHSNGGLLTFAALNEHPELFHSILFAGTPFMGGVGSLNDLHVGTGFGMNKRMLSPQVLFTHCLPFAFYPDEVESNIRLFEWSEKVEDRKPIKMDWFNYKSWENAKLGAYRDSVYSKLSTEEKNKFNHHFQNVLTVGKAFRTRLTFNPNITYPPIALLNGIGRPVVYQAFRNGPKSKEGWDFETPENIEGDGRVSTIGAVPPEGVPVYETYHSLRSHVELLHDPFVVKTILNSLLKAVSANEEY